jgi:hypothetical protein
MNADFPPTGGRIVGVDHENQDQIRPADYMGEAGVTIGAEDFFWELHDWSGRG